MGGCFSPGKNKVVIYIDLIDQIYVEAQKLSYTELNLNFYNHIHQKIAKKGLFRKLIDHLSSHRNNLNDSLMHNFRILRQKKSLESRYTGLVITDQLISNLDQFTSQQTIIKTLDKSQYVHKKKMEKVVINRDVDTKFQAIYFQMIIQLWQKESKIRINLMQSLCTYSYKKSDYFSCDKQIWIILDRLLNQIKTGGNLQISIKTYANLLLKSNQNNENNDKYLKQQSLRVFIKLWMKQNKHQQITQYCQKLLKIYISKCLTSREYGFIYNVIFQMYDQYFFKQSDILSIQNKILYIINQQDLKDHFLKGMFKHLLTYLCMCQNQNVKANWSQGLFDIHYEALKLKYKNILLKQNKTNGFGTLLRWINIPLVNITQLVSFNRNSLICCFLFNIQLFLQDKQVLDKIIGIFFQIYKRCQITSQIIIIQSLLQEIYNENKVLDSKQIVIKICKKILSQDNNVIERQSQCVDIFFRQISTNIINKIKIQLIELLICVIDLCKMPFSNILVQSICSTLCSFYRILDGNQTIQQKYYLVCCMLSLLKKLKDKKQYQILQVFFKNLNQQQEVDLFLMNKVNKYFKLYICYQISQYLQQPVNIPAQINEINMKIHINTNQQLTQQIHNYFYNYPIFKLAVIPQQIFYTDEVSKRKYESVKKQFLKYQKQSRTQRQTKLQINLNTGFQYKKNNSILSYQSSYKNDQSFQGIFGMIQQRKQNLSLFQFPQ